MFPFEAEENKELILEEESTPKEYEIDFTTGQLTGRVVTGLEAIITWAWLALRTERYRFRQYSWDYGQEFDDLIGQIFDQETLEMEVKQMLEDVFLIHPYILGVEGIEATQTAEGKLSVHCILITEYGEGEVDV